MRNNNQSLNCNVDDYYLCTAPLFYLLSCFDKSNNENILVVIYPNIRAVWLYNSAMHYIRTLTCGWSLRGVINTRLSYCITCYVKTLKRSSFH